jgi:methyl-accepting chemotaxis protein
VTEIAAASREQAQGIDQVNRVVAEMDKVTQQNAANAEQSASASQELKSQSGNIKQYIDDLRTMIGSGAEKEVENSHSFSKNIKMPLLKRGTDTQKNDKVRGITKKKVKAEFEDFTRLDDSDFKDF